MKKIFKNSYVKFFLLTIALELSVMFYLILGHRMVIGHDGFELFVHQWFFINSAIAHHEIPMWSPYLNHGTPVWWYFIYSRMDIFSNVWMLFSHWLNAGNFLGIFYGSLFFDKFILCCGVWLLAKRYFSSPVTVFFVVITEMATTVTYTQNSFCLIMFYCLPLIIYFLHRFFDTFNWKWLFLAAFLFLTVSINIFYFISIITLAIFIYFLTVAGISPGGILKGFKVDAKDYYWIGGSVLVLLLLVFIYFLGHDPTIYFSTTQRQSDGGVPLQVFLNYGGDNNLLKWWELFIGTSLRWDYTVYLGLLSIPLIIIGVFFSKNNNKKFFLWGALFFLLFSCATPISVAAYYFWPLMKSYRHIGYVAPLIKLYLCFLAGFGFEWLFCLEQDQDKKKILNASMLASAILFLNALFLCQLVIHPPLADFLLACLGPDIQHRVSIASISEYFFNMALFSLLGSLLFFFRPFIDFSKYASSYFIIFMLLHLGGLYWYAFDEIQLRTYPLAQQQYNLMDFTKIPFDLRRGDYDQGHFNARESILDDFQGLRTDAFNNFTFTDIINSKYRSDFCVRPFYKLFSIFEGQEHSPVLLKLTGVSQDKIQFFSNAHFVKSDDLMSRILLDKKYSGDTLFFQSSGNESSTFTNDWDKLDLSQNQRLIIPYQVLSFSPNQIVIRVNNVPRGAWMQYSDTWHPSWKAAINGQSQELYIGSLAYKALPLQEGQNTILLYVQSLPVELLYGFLMISSLLWVVLLIWLIVSFGL